MKSEGEGMLCVLVRKHNRRPGKVPVGKAIWVDLPCKNRTRQSLVNHTKSASHQLAVRIEISRWNGAAGTVLKIMCHLDTFTLEV